MTDDELKALVASLVVSQKEPDYWLQKIKFIGCAEERSAPIADDAPPTSAHPMS